MKEYDQSCVRADFRGDFVDTMGFFFDDEEYDKKKDQAIEDLTNEPDEKRAEMSDKRKAIFFERNDLIYTFYLEQCIKNSKYTYNDLAYYFENKYGWEGSPEKYGLICREAKARWDSNKQGS